MADGRLAKVFQDLLVEPPLDTLTDGELLRRFAADHQEAAFAELVTRHGPLVLGVCRRVLHNDHDTEDAFQATFLVLARKAASICKQNSVGSWLYKVAYRIALKAKADGSRRRNREQIAVRNRMPPSLGEVGQRELGRVLDEEVQRLPEKYRIPILLCYLQGRTNEEAARQLCWPTGTVKIRLLRAREMLRKRLVRRGVALGTSVLVAALLESAASAAVPATLASSAIEVGSLALTGQEASVVSAPVANLVEGALKKICLTKLKIAAAMLLSIFLIVGADFLMQNAEAAKPDVRLKMLPQPPSPAPFFCPQDAPPTDPGALPSPPAPHGMVIRAPVIRHRTKL
jgi:RNA polymerase sigma factor (sigma-70 family)